MQPRDQMLTSIVAATRYRQRDCHLSHTSIAAMHTVLGTRYGLDNLEAALRAASERQLMDCFSICRDVIERMDENRVIACPCCGSPVAYDTLFEVTADVRMQAIYTDGGWKWRTTPWDC